MAQDKNQKNGNKKSPFSIYWIYAILGIGLIAYQYYYSASSKIPLKTVAQFESLAEGGYVENVTIVINKLRADIRLNEDGISFLKSTDEKQFQNIKKAVKNQNTRGKSSGTHDFELNISDNGNFEKKIEEINATLKEGGKHQIPYTSETEYDYLSSILGFLLPIVLIFALWMFIMRRMSGGGGGPGGQIFNIGKSRAQVYDNGKSTNITFKDVAGLQGAKEEIEEIVEFLKNPKKYTELGAKIPKGALLVGPPGTGKTLLAKAVAGEAKVPFFSLSGSDFVEMFVGVGASVYVIYSSRQRKNLLRSSSSMRLMQSGVRVVKTEGLVPMMSVKTH